MKNGKDLICLSGATYEAREYSGVVVGGVWLDKEEVTPEVQARVEKTLASREAQDAPVDVVKNDEETDYYYNLL